MNANAQQYNETLRNWNQQWADAAMNAVKSHEQFVTNMVSTFSKPVGLETMQPPVREMAEKCMDFATRQTMEGEKFATGLVRDGIEQSRTMFKNQPEMNWPVDGEKARQTADKFVQETMKTTTEVVNREMAFVNERLNDAAEFGRSMMNCGCMAAGNVCGDTATDGKKRVVKA